MIFTTVYKKALAFIKRDISIQISYKFSFFMQFSSIFIIILTFYFIAKIIGNTATPYMEPYGGDYFSFVLIGIAFSGYLATGLETFSASIRQEQMMGTLELILITPTKISTMLLASSIWNYIFQSIYVLLYLIIGVSIFRVNMSHANIFAAFIVLILTIISSSSIGIISAAFIMIFKKGDPVAWFFGSVSGLLGGVVYPITVLPDWLQSLSHLLPITYSLRAMRHALLQGYSTDALAADIIFLILFSIIMLPISILLFKYAVKRARIDGSLIQY